MSTTELRIDKQHPSGSFTVQQSGPSGQITISGGTATCNGDFIALTVFPASAPIGPSPTTIGVSAQGRAASNPDGTCALRVQGGGGMATTVNVTFKNDGRGSDAQRRAPAAPQPAPAAAGPGAAPGRPGPGIPH